MSITATHPEEDTVAKLYAIKKTKNRITEYFYGGRVESHPSKKYLEWGNNPFSAQTFKTRDEAEATRFLFGTGGRVICLGDPACLRSEP